MLCVHVVKDILRRHSSATNFRTPSLVRVVLYCNTVHPHDPIGPQYLDPVYAYRETVEHKCPRIMLVKSGSSILWRFQRGMVRSCRLRSRAHPMEADMGSSTAITREDRRERRYELGHSVRLHCGTGENVG